MDLPSLEEAGVEEVPPYLVAEVVEAVNLPLLEEVEAEEVLLQVL